MKMTRWVKYTLASFLALGISCSLRAAEAPAGQDKKPTREDWQKMTPEERQSKMKEWRDKLKNAAPDNREAQRKVWRERMEKKLDELKKKKADGTITAEETQQLERLVGMMKRWEHGGDPGGPGAVPTKPDDVPKP